MKNCLFFLRPLYFTLKFEMASAKRKHCDMLDRKCGICRVGRYFQAIL